MKGLPSEAKIFLQILFTVLLGAIVSVRFWIQRWRPRTRALIATDVLVAVAYLTLLALTIGLTYEDFLILEARRKHRGYGLIQLPSVSSWGGLVAHWVGDFCYLVNLWCIKGAFIASYFDIFSDDRVKMKYRHAIYVLCGYTILTFLVNIFGQGFQCVPMNIPAKELEVCIAHSSAALSAIGYATNISSDIFLFGIIWKLLRTLGPSARFHCEILFMAFIFSILITAPTICFALSYILLLQREDLLSTFAITDVVDAMEITAFWSLVESWAFLLAVSLPPLRVLLRRRKRGSGEWDMGLRSIGLESGTRPESRRRPESWDSYVSETTP